jgi:hypothetical protein
MKYTFTMAVAALAFAAPLAGQQGVAVTQPVETRAALERQVVERARASVESRITPGAPYSADAVTESVQVLSDGNRIVSRTATRIYRDSEGRTRREQLTTSGDVRSVNISDPVAGSTYLLNPADRTAQRAGVIMTSPAGSTRMMVSGSLTVTGTRIPEEEAAGRREVEAQAASGGSAGRGVRGRGAASAGSPPVEAATMVYPATEAVTLSRTTSPAGGAINKEDLGQQLIEGVLASGTRITTTFPAGAIGNEKPIVVVSEQWFSEDLKVLVMTKHNDPRSGQTIYRLSNVVQAEPARSLFEVPADYTLKESVIRRQSPMLPHD